jgi:hypothetical protein
MDTNRRHLLAAGVAGAASSIPLAPAFAMQQSASPFATALIADGPAPDLADKLKLYGQFVGAWEAEAEAFLPDGSRRRHYWHIAFAWVLEGRAVQDVWITPTRRGPRVGQSQPWGPFSNQYGTTLRVYDPKIDAWRVTWIDPAAGYRADLIGRPDGDGIFQEGTGSDGARLRWIFSDIAHDRFRWRAEVSRDQGAHWHKAIDLLAKRSEG